MSFAPHHNQPAPIQSPHDLPDTPRSVTAACAIIGVLALLSGIGIVVIVTMAFNFPNRVNPISALHSFGVLLAMFAGGVLAPRPIMRGSDTARTWAVALVAMLAATVLVFALRTIIVIGNLTTGLIVLAFVSAIALSIVLLLLPGNGRWFRAHHPATTATATPPGLRLAGVALISLCLVSAALPIIDVLYAEQFAADTGRPVSYGHLLVVSIIDGPTTVMAAAAVPFLFAGREAARWCATIAAGIVLYGLFPTVSNIMTISGSGPYGPLFGSYLLSLVQVALAAMVVILLSGGRQIGWCQRIRTPPHSPRVTTTPP